MVANADAVNPTLAAGWLEYAQHAGFATDTARVRKPRDKPKVERAVQYVRGNFFAGEAFADLSDAQAKVVPWCTRTAGTRIHGTTAAQPGQVFTQDEKRCLLPVPAAYDVPTFTRVKVHGDFHVEVARALYSVPGAWLGQYLDARADQVLVKLFHQGKLVKTHPRQPPGGRVTEPAALPKEKAGYALRDLTKLIAAAAAHGKNIGIYAERLLDDPLPWTRMRAVYRLLGLVRRYGPEPVEAACSTSLDLDVVSVTKIASMLAIATEKNPPCCRPRPTPRPGGSPATPGVRHGRARHPAHPHPRRSDRPHTRKGDHPMSTPHPRDDQPDRSHRPLPGPARTEAVGAQRHPARTPRPGPDPQDGPRRVPGTPPVRRGLTPRLPLGDAACPHRRPGPHHGPRHLDQNPTTCATTGCCCPT